MFFTLDKKLFLYLAAAFFVATIVGTVSHESGHYLVAKLLGFDAKIDYTSTWLKGNQFMSFPEQAWFLAGGPLQTMITGTCGLILLCFCGKLKNKLSARQWFFVLLSLFWLRQLANFFTWITAYFITGTLSERMDEVRLSIYFFNEPWFIISVTALISLIILAVIQFRFIPLQQRFTFMLAGLTGGITGYWFWLIFAGKYIMP